MADVNDTLAERGARYGDFSDHAAIAQKLQDDMRGTDGWSRLTADKKQALTVIADKIARILSGDPEYRDNWHDLQGYAKLAEDRCVTAVSAAPSDDSVWIEYTPGDPHPTDDECAKFQLRGGQIYAREGQHSWDWSECHDGTIARYVRAPGQ